MNYIKQTFNFSTHYDYYILPEKEQLFAKIKNAYIKVNPIYDKKTPFFPIRTSKSNVEYVSKYNIFSPVKTEKKKVIEITDKMTIEEKVEAKKINNRAYHREYQKDYIRKKRTKEIKAESIITPLPNPKNLPVQPLTWFVSNIGYIVYRDKPTCKCDDCERLLGQGWVIQDDNDALRLYNEQIKYNIRFETRLNANNQ